MKRHVTLILFAAVTVATLVAAAPAEAQNNSLYAAAQQQPVAVNNSLSAAQPQRGPGLSLADASWTYQSAVDKDKKQYEINDIVKVTVSVKSQMTSTGQNNRQKTGYSDWKLTNWIKIYQGGSLGEVGGQNGQAPYGAPEIRGDLDSKMQAQGNLQTSDSMNFVISCRIVDKRPNGNLVLEGTWSVSDNEEKWEYSLAGECRPQDIKGDNTILSNTIADLSVIKREAGNVRDSYRRGWMLEWFDKWQPF